jgi:choline dehydrogenase-like flavoprotein
MSKWLSDNAETLVECAAQARTAGRRPQVLVVGSGYGGAVAAQRFAEAGQSVWLLERGHEYLAGDFPQDVSEAPGHVRCEVHGPRGTQALGYESGLFDFRVGDGGAVLLGNGLGGGSLINAAVALQPELRVFDRPEWPAALRDGVSWSHCFDRARQGLGVQDGATQRAAASPPQATLRRQRLEDLARAARARAEPDVEVTAEDVPLAIEFRRLRPAGTVPTQACNGCGNCASGCNHHAKLSVDKTYLARARLNGARLFTGVSALWVSAIAPEYGGGWRVHAVRTAERALWADTERAHAAASSPASSPASSAPGTQAVADRFVFTVDCDRLVLAAGALGSTELLQRSAQQGLRVACGWLGQGMSGNGDDLSMAAQLPQPVRGFGETAHPMPPSAPNRGPTITGVVRFRHATNPLLSTVTEDGGMPGLLKGLVGETVATLATLHQVARWGFKGGGLSDPLAVGPRVDEHSLALLGMGHDRCAGCLTLPGVAERSTWSWVDGRDATAGLDPSLRLHRQRLSALHDLGGLHIPNPATGVMPEALAQVMDKGDFRAPWITVHPLGGCRMADSAEQGVVNDRCEVWGDHGQVLAGLMVMDGSVVPASLGVNPFLTITALAERACELALAAPVGQGEATPSTQAPCGLRAGPLAEFPRVVGDGTDALSQATVPATPPRGAWLNEVLRGRLTVTDALWEHLPHWRAATPQAQTPPESLAVSLFLEMDVPDWASLWADPQHRAGVVPGVDAPAATEQRLTASRLVLDVPGLGTQVCPVVEGQVQVFHPRGDGWGRRLWRTGGVLLTYALDRLLADASLPPPPGQAPRTFPQTLAAMVVAVQSAWHAAHLRGFTYNLRVDLAGVPVRLQGCKDITPVASGAALRDWLATAWRTGQLPKLQRRSVWAQLTEVDLTCTVEASALRLGHGRFRMDVPEMLRRVVPQLQFGPDTLSGLVAFLSYPMMIGRHLLYSRVLDFRYPDQKPHLPATDWAAQPDDGQFELRRDAYRDLVLHDGTRVPAQEPVCVQARLRAGLSGAAADASPLIRTGLVRYRQPQVEHHDTAHGTRRWRSIILMNGFAQNTLPFIADELGPDALACLLYEQGWDVWLFEYRVSPFLRASAPYSTMDDIAAGEIPAAVDHVLATLCEENGIQRFQDQVFVLSHCVGSASLAMSVLGGRLRHDDGRSKLAGVLFSQFQPFVIGSETSQMRLQVASLLTGAGVDCLQFAAGHVAPDGLHAAVDMLFSSLDYPPDQDRACPHDDDRGHPHPDGTTCKRMSGLLSPLFAHHQLHEVTHEKLDQYFGRTNLGVFVQGAKCVEAERLVNADGQDVYATAERLVRHLDMPVMVLHGADNRLFSHESLDETQRQLQRVASAQRRDAGADVFFKVPDHAHFDVTIGKNAPQVVFPKVLAFFNKAYGLPAFAPPKARRLRARLPRTGPIVGWTRVEGDRVVARLWAEVDDQHNDRTLALMTVLYVNGQAQAQCWRVRRARLGTEVGGQHAPSSLKLRYAVADLSWPLSAQGTVNVLAVSLHRYHDGDGDGAADTGLARWGLPMTVAEAQGAGGRTPLFNPVPPQAQAAQASAPVLPARQGSRWREPGEQAAQAVQVVQVVDAASPQRVQPFAVRPTLAQAHDLLRPLAASLAASRQRALGADPATLSRQVRRVAYLRDAWVRLRPATWRPAADRVDLLAATCHHPGLTPLESWRSDRQLAALARLQQQRPAAFMWMLGDQIYADASGGLADAASPVERFLPKYRKAFNADGFAALARHLPLTMVMDDHELGDNWSVEHLDAGAHQRLAFDNAWLAYRVFQSSHSASGGAALDDVGSRWGGVASYRLNTRVHRDRQHRRLLTEGQWAALERWLVTEQALGNHPKLLACGSVVAPGVRELAGEHPDRTGDTWQSFPAERRRLFDLLVRHRVHGVVLLSGDYHCAAFATLDFDVPGLSAVAIVAPPLHAPMRFANVPASGVLATEQVVLSAGLGQVRIDAQALEGDGWVRCGLRRGAGGGWGLQAEFTTSVLDGEPQGLRVFEAHWS